MNEKSSFAFFNLSDNVNLLSIIGAVVIFLAVFIVVNNAYRQMKQKRAEVELVEEVWDGIGEYKNPLPLGWALMFVILIVFAVWYFLVGYPLNKYSSIGEYNEEVSAYNAKYNARYETLNDEQKVAMGESVFMVQCAPCHGLEGNGINGKAQDLTRWGSKDGIVYTLKNGSTGLGYGQMQKGEDLGLESEEDMNAVASYIVSELSKSQNISDKDALTKGEELYANACSSCHGEQGEGMEGVAPALNNYGTYSFAVNVLHSGKIADPDLKEGVLVIGAMPSFSHILSNNQIEAVARYVSSLSKQGE